MTYHSPAVLDRSPVVHDAYRNFMRTPSGLILSEDAARLRYGPKREVLGGDFYSGCGGAALGFKQAGIKMLFGVEWDVSAAVTYLANLGSFPLKLHIETEALTKKFEKMIMSVDKGTGMTKMMVSGQHRPAHVSGTDAFWIWDITKITGQMILDDHGLQPGDLDVLHGSPPCQGFSKAGKQDINDARNNHMFEYARLICEIQPKTFTLEQVPDVQYMTTADGQPMLEAFTQALEHGGYAKRKTLEKMIEAQGGKQMLMRRSKVEKAESKPKATPPVDAAQMAMF